jgi:predicted site-specific integrase-resolvase
MTTRHAARAAGISHQSLYSWIKAGYIPAPPVELVESQAVRLWTEKDVERIRAWKRKNFKKGIGRPAKDAQ